MQNNKQAEMPDLPELTNPRQWVCNYADYLYCYAIIRINDQEQARDLVQETFLAALESLSHFEGKSTEKTWLTAILRNKIIDLYRKKSSGLYSQNEILEEEHEQQDFFDEQDGHWNNAYRPQEFAAAVENPLQHKEFERVLQGCMNKLPNLWYAVFSMKHVDEESTEIICSTLKVTPANFWVIIHRAKLSLRACLQKYWI
ncbi:sigma-70 family RNA polymerase sigma factor [Pedobacter foliorum]